MPTPCPVKMTYGPNVLATSLDNAVIPLTGKYKLIGKTVYAEDEVQYLYTEYTLMFDLVIYPQISTGSDDMESEANRIRTILSTPGLQLSIYPIGVGTFGVINLDHYDLKGGPFPQDIEVEPFVANRAIAIRGSIMFRISPCLVNGGTSGAPILNSRLVQNVVEQDISVNEDGIVEFTFHYTIQYANPVASPIGRATLHNLTNPLIRASGKQFQGMKKKTRMSISKDGRIYRIRVVYTEHESDSPFYPYTKNIDCEDNLESSLMGEGKGKGFYKWQRSIDCTIKLPPRVHKSWAWFIYKSILQERFKNLQILNKVIAAPMFNKPAEQPANANDTKPWYIPLKIRITNSIYNRTLKLHGSYLIVCSLKEIIATSKILDTVDIGGALAIDDQWESWQNSQTDLRLNGYLRYDTSNIPIVFNQCTNDTTIPTVSSGQTIPTGTSNPESVYEPPAPASNSSDESARIPKDEMPPELSWIDYKNKFEIIEDGSIVPVSYLEAPSVPSSGRTYYQAGDNAATTDRNYDGTVINNRTSGATQNHPVITIPRGHSVFYVRMKGYALRYGYKPAIPYVVSVGGKTVKRLHQRAEVSPHAAGERPVYIAKWDVLYVVEGGDPYTGDLVSNIVTSGSPNRYT